MNEAQTKTNAISGFTLASGSPYKKQQLTMQFKLPITALPPNIDEASYPGESASQTALRLSAAKAEAIIGKSEPTNIIIAGDQTAEFEGKLLKKPGSAQRAREQLREFSGKSVSFYSGACVVNPCTGAMQSTVTKTQVTFRTLSLAEIDTYLKIDAPNDCVGAFKNEALGIVLFDEIISKDPSALTGLPLIGLNKMLLSIGVNLLEVLQKQDAPPHICPE